MKKQTKIILIAVAVLVVAVGVLAALNAGNIGEKNRLQTEQKFRILRGTEVLCEIGMDEILALNPVDFTAVMDTSTTDPTEVTFTGVEIKAILAAKNIAFDAVTSFEFRALDGYSSAISPAEFSQDNNVYLCIKKDGKPLLTKAEGGMGPYLMIVKSATFSQRWCKFLQELVLK